MTIIMGLTFRGGAAVAADSLRHNALGLAHAEHADKTVTLNQRTVAAKGGYGPDADGIWQALRETGIGDVGPAEIARRLRLIGEGVYAECRQRARDLGANDPGLFLFVAGTEPDGRSALHWLNFQLQDFGHTNQVGCAIALASRRESTANALYHARRLAQDTGAGLWMHPDRWARDLTEDERQYVPHAIGFPVNLRTVRGDGILNVTLIEGGPENQVAAVRMD